MDFQAYSGAYYRDKSQGAAQWVDGRTPIPFLEVLALRMMWALEFQMVSFESSHMHDFASELVVKLIHEIRCLVACARAGSSFGTFSHARGTLECAAMGQYVFGSGEKLAQERALRWATYRKAVRYLHRRHLELQRERGEVSDAEFAERCVAGPDAIDVTGEELSEWERIFGKKACWFQSRAERSEHMETWFAPATYITLLDEITESSELTSARLSTGYRHLSKATHLGPLSSGVIGKGKLVQLDEARRYHFEALVVYRAVDVVLALLPPSIGTPLAELTMEERYQLVTVGLELTADPRGGA